MNIPFRPILSAMTRPQGRCISSPCKLRCTRHSQCRLVISQRIAYLSRPSIDEAGIVVVDNRWASLTAREA